MSVLLNSLKPPEMIHRQCLDTQFRPHQYSELVISQCIVKPEKIANYFCQCTVELNAKAETEHRSCRRESHVALETRTSFEVET